MPEGHVENVLCWTSTERLAASQSRSVVQAICETSIELCPMTHDSDSGTLSTFSWQAEPTEQHHICANWLMLLVLPWKALRLRRLRTRVMQIQLALGTTG